MTNAGPNSRPIRVLIVDDSVVIRKLLSEFLATEPTLEVVGTASNGRLALRQIELLKPDLVTLDVEMPQMNGLEALLELRKTHPSLPVIVLSAACQQGAAATVELLAAGATDYIGKPDATTGLEAGLRKIRDALMLKIHSIFPAPGRLVPNMGWPRPQASEALPSTGRRNIEIVVIGVSTGGPGALCSVIPRLPADLPVPVLVVQHMPPVFTAQLAARLDSLSFLQVREAVPGQVIKAGQVWVAPGDYHLMLTRVPGGHALATNQDPPENSCRPAVDVLFRSVAENFGPRALAVVMTGMGFDALKGSDAVRRAGGQIIVQDEASSVVWSMPGSVAGAGLADNVVPLEGLADEISRRVRESRT